MKLKYYLRGLGAGIILTVIILMISSSGEKNTMTDEEIMERAQALGMVMAEEEPNDTQDDGDSAEDASQQDNEVENTQSTKPEDNEAEDAQGTKPEDNEAEDAQGTKPEDNEAENTQSTEPEEDAPEADQSVVPEENKAEADQSAVPEENKAEADQRTEPEDNEAEAAQSATQEDEPVYVMIEVVGGEFSDKISTKLYEAGLVSDAKEFNQYLVKNGIDNRIAAGKHQIPQGASIEEIAAILCERPINE